MSLLGRRGRYYRPLYSLFAFLSLGGVIVVQFSIKSVYLTSPERTGGSLAEGPTLDVSCNWIKFSIIQLHAIFPLLKYLVGLTVGVPGVILMCVCIRKYFFNLSGVKAFFRGDDDVRLESGGIHAYVRHPLYLGTLATLWSVFLFFPLLSNLLACLFITVYTLIGIRLEEQKLLKVFGEAYAAYRRRTPMLIPNFPFR